MRSGLDSSGTENELKIGTVLTLPGVASAELIAEAFDLVWIDLEHAALSLTEAAELVIGTQAAGALALVRLPAGEHHSMTVMLDAGADGIVLADVREPQVAKAAINRATHPPRGSRGWGPRRLSTRGRVESPSMRPTICAQIENSTGVATAAEIASIDGIDSLVVGTADLSFDLGDPLTFDSDALLSAIASVRDAAARTGTAFGLAGPLDVIAPAALSGASVLVHSTDARMIAASVDRSAAEIRARAMAPGKSAGEYQS